MYFNPNKTPVEGVFGGTCFRDIYFGDNGKQYIKSLKEFDVLKNKDKDFFCSDYCNVRFQMIKDSVGKFVDYLISPKIRQILLHQGYHYYLKYKEAIKEKSNNRYRRKKRTRLKSIKEKDTNN